MQAMLQAFCALCVLGLVTLSRGNTTPVAELDECSSLQVAGPSTHAALAMEGSRLNGSVNFSLSNSPCAPVRFVGVSGLLLTAKACWASEAMELLSSLLARMKLLEQSQECIHCDAQNVDQQPCCCYFYQENVLTNSPDFGATTQPIELRFELLSERGFDQDLVEISRQLPFPDVTKRNDFLKQLHDKGIFKAVQMQSLKSKDLGDLSGNPLLLNKLQAEMSMQAAGTKKNKARNEAIKRRKDAMEDTEEGLADLERLLNTELSDAQTSSNDLRRQVQEDMARARQALNQVELESADLDTSDERNQLDAAITSGGFVNGQQLPLSTLISYAGVMRGVRLASFGSVNPIGLAQVVQFTPEMQAMSEEELRSTVAVHPAQSSLEVSLETERAGDFANANVEFDTLGTSSLESSSHSISATGSAGYAGMFGSFDVSAAAGTSDSASSGSADDRETKVVEKLDEHSKSLYKSRYHVEPRLRLEMLPEMLASTRHFDSDVQRLRGILCKVVPAELLNKECDEKLDAADIDQLLKDSEEIKTALDSIFFKFGTHVCPQVVLGGWWRLAASYRSVSKQKQVDKSNILTQALNDAEAKASFAKASVSGSFGGFSGSAAVEGHKTATEAAETSKTNSNRDVKKDAYSEAHIEVSQAWRGGASGTPPADWRRSLDDTMNSNWRVIDREFSRCVGVWSWANSDDLNLRNLMCQHWLNNFGKSRLDADSRQIYCNIDDGLRFIKITTTTAAPWGPWGPPTPVATGLDTATRYGVACNTNDCISRAVCPFGYALTDCKATDKNSNGVRIGSNFCDAIGETGGNLVKAEATCSRTKSTVVVTRDNPNHGQFFDPGDSNSPFSLECPAGSSTILLTCFSPWDVCKQVADYDDQGRVPTASGFVVEPFGEVFDSYRETGKTKGVHLNALCEITAGSVDDEDSTIRVTGQACLGRKCAHRNFAATCGSAYAVIGCEVTQGADFGEGLGLRIEGKTCVGFVTDKGPGLNKWYQVTAICSAKRYTYEIYALRVDTYKATGVTLHSKCVDDRGVDSFVLQCFCHSPWGHCQDAGVSPSFAPTTWKECELKTALQADGANTGINIQALCERSH